MNMKTFGIPLLLTAYLSMLIALWVAFLSGSWRVIMDFNYYGEGMLELIVFTLGLVPVAYTLRELVRSTDAHSLRSVRHKRNGGKR